ncbi:Serine/threonine-protein kinase [Coemansia sp. RSA 720]|nr:Serine/threonine-protein kinase [Coemansia sp. RSA 720]
MNVLADEFELSPRTPIAFYPPRPGAIQQVPGVARQMSALARAVHNAVSPHTEAANGPINTQAVVDGASSRRVATGRTIHGVFNPLDAVLAETFESRHSQGTAQEDPTIRRMEGLAYKALAMIYLADMKWRLLPRAPPVTDPLANPENGFLDPSDLTIEEAFVLYLRALSLLHRAMVDASRHWASLHPDDMSDGGSGTQSTGASLKTSVTVSAAFNGAVQWVRSKFNECLERAEMLKQLANGHELDNVGQVSVVQVLYEQALAISKVAAQRELRWIDPFDCDSAYQLAIWMLSAILESDSDSPYVSRQTKLQTDAGADQEVGPHDRTIVERFIVSIVKRREALQRRLMQLQPVDV